MAGGGDSLEKFRVGGAAANQVNLLATAAQPEEEDVERKHAGDGRVNPPQPDANES